MGYNNTVAIVSNSEFVVKEIKGMLVLLRDIDTIECFDYFDAEESIKKLRPNVIILHSNDNIKNALKLLEKIKKNEETKNTPVLLYSELAGADSVVEAFDLGVSDIISCPLKDYELIIRVIWAIRKNDAYVANKIKDSFLAKLGIIDENTGFYKKDFSLRYLETVISKAKEARQKSCLIMIKAQSAIGSVAEKEQFMQSLKNSVRLNDTIAMKNSTTFYVFLSKARMDGIYTIYERLLSGLKNQSAISASAVEIQDDIFDDIINVLDYKLSKMPKNGELAVVTKQDFLDMWKNDEAKPEKHEELGIAKLFKKKNVTPEQIIQVDEKTILEPPSLDSSDLDEKLKNNISIEEEILSDPIFNDEREKDFTEEIEPKQEELKQEENTSTGVLKIPENLSAGLKKMMEEKVPIKLNREKFKLVKKPKTDDIKSVTEEENREIDERNAILYKQAYARKLSVVVEPLFKKYSSKLQNEHKGLNADINVSPFDSHLKLNKDDIKLNLEVEYDGLKSVNLKILTAALGTEIDSENIAIDVMDFDYQKLDTVLKTVVSEYKNYLTGN